MRWLLLLALLAGAGVARATQVIYGHTFTAPGTIVIASTNTPAKDSNAVVTVSDTAGWYMLYVTNGFTGNLYPCNSVVSLTPTNYCITNLQTFFQADFTNSPAAIYGTVYGTGGVAVAGVPIDVQSADGSFVLLSGSAGQYGASLTNPWTGTVSLPPMYGLTFYPSNLVLSGLASNYQQNFSLGGEYVAGIVTNDYTGLGLDGVTINFGATNAITTNGGRFSITLTYGWAGTISPVVSNGYMIPTGIVVSSLQNIYTNANFAYRVFYPKVSGRVVRYRFPATGVANVPIVWSDGTTIWSDAYGYYSRIVPAGWSGTGTPTAPPLVFFPASRTFTNVTRSQSNRGFTWVPPGYTYQDPMAFLTNRLPDAAPPPTFARADQVSTIPLPWYMAGSTLQTNLVLWDAEFSRVVADVVSQRAYTEDLHPEVAWAPSNAPTMWGRFISDMGLWATTNAVFTNAVVSNLTTHAVEAQAVVSPALQSVWGQYDASPQVLVSQTSGWSWALCPAYTATVAGVYTMDSAVMGSLVVTPETNVTFVVSNSVGAFSRTAVVSRALTPVSVRGIMYLDSGTVVQPRLTLVPSFGMTNMLTPALWSIQSIRRRSVSPTIQLWE